MRDKTSVVPFPLPQLHSNGVMTSNLHQFKEVVGEWLMHFAQELYLFFVCHKLQAPLSLNWGI